MGTFIFALASVGIVSLISLIGLASLALGEAKIRSMLPYVISFAAGALLGNAIIHLLPTAFAMAQDYYMISLTILSALVAFFILEKLLYWHRCYHIGHCEHTYTLGITNIIGDGLHNFMDGIIIAGSFLVSIPLGLTTTLAVALHEIPQEISDFGVLLHAGYPIKKALLFNFLSALAAFAGTILVFVASTALINLTTFLVPFTAGSFIYIACSNLIPELHHETNIRAILLQLLFLLLGIAVIMILP